MKISFAKTFFLCFKNLWLFVEIYLVYILVFKVNIYLLFIYLLSIHDTVTCVLYSGLFKDLFHGMRT